MDKFLLGTNPLLGVDHMDRARARTRRSTLDLQAIVRIIETSLRAGAQGLTFTVGPDIYSLLVAMKGMDVESAIGLYPLVPDVQTFRAAIAEGKFLTLAEKLTKGLSLIEKTAAFVRGGVMMAKGDPIRLIELSVDMELKKLTKLKPPRATIKAVFIHEIMTDMAITLNAESLMKDLVIYISNFGVVPGFVTRNLCRFVEVCRGWGVPIERVAIMTPINKLGFQMTPSREACEVVLNELNGTKIVAMSPLAGGRLGLEDGISYLKSIHNLASIAIGLSSEVHARETFEYLRKAMG
jgi:hypothetical protein